MRLDRYTVKAQEALQAAQTLASEMGNQEITSEHLLLALLGQPEGIVPPLMQKLGVPPQALAAEVQREVERLPKVGGVSGGERLSQRLKQSLDRAWDEAQRLKDEYLSTEHMLLGIADEKDSPAGRVLRAHGVTRDSVLKALVDVRGSAR